MLAVNVFDSAGSESSSRVKPRRPVNTKSWGSLGWASLTMDVVEAALRR